MKKNIPYVKQYNTQGELLNPIIERYEQGEPDRRTRRASMRNFKKEVNKVSKSHPEKDEKGLISIVMKNLKRNYVK